MPAIVASKATLPRSYPATPLVAPPDGARLSIMARDSLGQLSRQPHPLTHGEPTRRASVGGGVRLTATGAEAVLTQRLAQDAEFDGSARALHRRANTAYVRTRDSHIRLLPGYEQVDLTV